MKNTIQLTFILFAFGIFNTGFAQNNCLDFDGTDDYVLLNDRSLFTGLTALTVEAWVYSTASSGWHEIFQVYPNNITLALSGTGLYAFMNDNAQGTQNSISIANAVEVNKWYHVAMTWDVSGNLILYSNGIEIGRITNSSTDALVAGTGGPYIGALVAGSELFQGKMDELRLWNDVRTSDELRENMCKELDGNEGGLIGYYKFNQTSGSNLLDISPSNNYGTLSYMDDTDWVDSEAFTTWTGITSSAWATATNWSDGVPGSSDNVGLYDYGNSDPVIPTGQTVNNIVVGSSVSTQVSAGENLTVNGNFFNYGDFTVASTSMGVSGTGSLIVGGETSGNITFQRYADVISKGEKWHYVSAPVSGQTLNTTWMTANDIGFTNPAYQFFRFSELYNYWIYFDYEGSVPEPFADNTFVDARGYCLARTSDGLLSFSGTPITENVTYAATYTEGQGNGFNLVGNPFTSAIGVTEDASTTGNFLAVNTGLLDDNYEALYIWDEATGYTFGSQDYKVISNAGITGYTSISQDYIAPGQAFMVKVNAGGNLLFNTNMQTHSTVAAYKSKETWPSVELCISGNETSNTTAIGFHSDMTTGLDPSYDAAKFKGNPNLSLYTKLLDDNGKDFAIQALPDQNIEDYIVPIGVDVAEGGVFEFSATQENLKNYSLILEDRQENTFTDLRWETCFATICESGTGRFYLHFKDATAIGEIAPETKISFRVFDGKIIINNPELESGNISLVNVSGQILKRFDLDGNSMQEFTINPVSGIYIISIQTEKAQVSRKVFIK